MKTTFDLPPELVREVKLRAVHEGRKLKDVAAELLKRGLADPGRLAKQKPSKPRTEIQANGLPVILCGKDAPVSRMTTEELLALEQETLFREDLQRVGRAL
ncbi:MAG: hypothetical protein WED15_06640 [Akkermansiaceae bacterium]